MSILSCLLGKHFTIITYISVDGRAGQQTRGSFSRPQLLGLPISLCVRFGNPLGIRIPSDSLTEWINEDHHQEFVESSLKIQDSPSPTMVSTSLLGNRLKASSKLQLVTTMMGRLTLGHTLRNWASAATTEHSNSF